MDGMELDTEKGKKRKMITNHRGRFPERDGQMDSYWRIREWR